MKIFKQLFIILAAIFVMHFQSHAQNDEQLWIDFQLSYPFGGKYLLENTTSYQTLLNKNEKWRNISISPVFEYSLFSQLDLLSEFSVGYTIQKEGVSTWELMPMVGGRFFVRQNKRFDARLVWRYQTRFFRQIEAEDWDVSNRTRLRVELFGCINGPTLYTDKLLYGFADYEEFIVLDQQLDERYANRRRARIGLGYRFSYKHRFEFSYARQSSRNQIEGEFISDDNVLQFKYKMYLNPARAESMNQN